MSRAKANMNIPDLSSYTCADQESFFKLMRGEKIKIPRRAGHQQPTPAKRHLNDGTTLNAGFGANAPFSIIFSKTF